ncbi:MAG: ABC transporter permease [Chthoniobacterales bacterium]
MIGDLRYALRMLLKSRGFFVVAFFAIALGIGVNTTIFSVVNTLLLRPLPVGHPERLVQIYTLDVRNGKQANSYLNFLDFAKQNTVFSAIAAYQFVPMGWSSGGETTNVFAETVSGNYFSLLQVKLSLGRGFLPEEDRTPDRYPVVVLSDRFWKKLGGDRAIIGSTLTLNGRQFTVLGVAPPKFTGTDVGISPDLWVPLAMRGWVTPATLDWYENRRALMLNLIARLKPEVSLAQAEAQLKTVARHLELAYPEFNKERSVVLATLESSKTQGLGGPDSESGVQNISALLIVAAASILLIACANVANLLLARATTREREMAVRLALGAGRARIVRQLLTESVLLALIGGAGGIVLAYWLGDVLLALLPATPMPLALDPAPDGKVLSYAFLLALGSGVIFGLAPALQTARWDLTQGLRERAASGGGGGARFNLRNLLVIAQIAVSLLLLIGSGLFLKAFHNAQLIDPGFRTSELALLSFDLNLAGYDNPRGLQTIRQLLEQLRRIPQVKRAEAGEWVPLGFGGRGRTIYVEGRDSDAELNRKFANFSTITPGYFETLGVPLLKGRKFDEHDAEMAAPPVAIINQTMARQLWPNEDAVGQRFHFFQSEPVEVIGIAKDIKAVSLGEMPAPMVYQPMTDSPKAAVTLFIQTIGAPGPVLAEAHRLVRAADTRIPITYEKTVAEHMAFALWPSWMGALLLGAFGLLALVLASMGVYGVMAYSVSQRTREIGIRMALGAQSREVVGLVLRQGMILAAIGLLVGLLAACGLTRLLAALLYGVNPNDPTVFLGVTVLLAAAAFAACYFPARRAVKIDPVVALRFD